MLPDITTIQQLKVIQNHKAIKFDLGAGGQCQIKGKVWISGKQFEYRTSFHPYVTRNRRTQLVFNKSILEDVVTSSTEFVYMCLH